METIPDVFQTTIHNGTYRSLNQSLRISPCEYYRTQISVWKSAGINHAPLGVVLSGPRGPALSSCFVIGLADIELVGEESSPCRRSVNVSVIDDAVADAQRLVFGNLLKHCLGQLHSCCFENRVVVVHVLLARACVEVRQVRVNDLAIGGRDGAENEVEGAIIAKDYLNVIAFTIASGADVLRHGVPPCMKANDRCCRRRAPSVGAVKNLKRGTPPTHGFV
jgi:hypothetical protein